MKTKQEATNKRSQEIKYRFKFAPYPSMNQAKQKVESTQDPFA